ncbi:hypothetical protein [Erythrobacter sp. JK5]|uniref:hypothetical protein n=1 Tax=Erythrobacter sp. JK5 TaxID=2829500 RepID=UPI001BADE924|nr:hypothetical protein [Erythrobacter sp. JK5]QUL38311.1 hypothetical protein KDC96_02525 [Erythrobacter sp. JK5]
MPARIDRDVSAVLRRVARVLEAADDPWWVIGSAAVALHGGSPGAIGDIDVIVSRRDLDWLYEELPLTATPDETKDVFLSERFGRWSEPALDVEFMTGLKVRVGGEWSAVEPRSRKAIRIGKAQVFVPERAELIAMLQRFGREKDVRRAATLM